MFAIMLIRTLPTSNIQEHPPLTPPPPSAEQMKEYEEKARIHRERMKKEMDDAPNGFVIMGM